MPRRKSPTGNAPPQSESLAALGAQIRRLRLERNLKQERLAELASLNYKYLGRIELAQTNTTAAILIRLAKALDVTVGELFDTTMAPVPRRQRAPADLEDLSAQVAALTAAIDALVAGQTSPPRRRASRRPRRQP